MSTYLLCDSTTVLINILFAGDDEQSDFYCEPDYPCAGGIMAASMIAGARLRWKSEHYRQFPSDSHLARLHHDVCNQASSPSLRSSYKTRCKILVCVRVFVVELSFDNVCGHEGVTFFVMTDVWHWFCFNDFWFWLTILGMALIYSDVLLISICM